MMSAKNDLLQQLGAAPIADTTTTPGGQNAQFKDDLNLADKAVAELKKLVTNPALAPQIAGLRAKLKSGEIDIEKFLAEVHELARA